jgi:hypothetical protein
MEARLECGVTCVIAIFVFQGTRREPRVCSLVGRWHNKCGRVRYKDVKMLKDAMVLKDAILLKDTFASWRGAR